MNCLSGVRVGPSAWPVPRFATRGPAETGSVPASHPRAGVWVRSGYRTVVLLRREGWPVSHKQVYLLYAEEGLTLNCRKAAANRKLPALPTASNERWAMDFNDNTLAAGAAPRNLLGARPLHPEVVGGGGRSNLARRAGGPGPGESWRDSGSSCADLRG